MGRSSLGAKILLVVAQTTVLRVLSSALGMSIINYEGGDHHVVVKGLVRGEEAMKRLYEEWMVTYDKSYGTAGEEERRFGVFKDNLRFIDEHNHPRNNHTYVVGLNHFADLTNQEYRSAYMGTHINVTELLISAPISKRYEVRKWDKLPSSIDWRSRGAVGRIKNQGTCESCWAFSAIATVEGLNQIITGDLITLSEQELVDCDRSNNGCHRGLPHKAYQYVMKRHGVDTDANYPYISQNGIEGTCKKNRDKVVSIDRYEYGPFNDENAMKKAVANQPISVAVDSSSRAFQFYKSVVLNAFNRYMGIHKGVLTGHCGTAVDHAVVIVGYGTDGNTEYWIVRNSWTDRWGESGYMRLERNAASRHGKCGIAKYFTYPVKRGFPMRSPWASN